MLHGGAINQEREVFFKASSTPKNNPKNNAISESTTILREYMIVIDSYSGFSSATEINSKVS
ncbi:MAG: hypothetical protein M3P08_20070 [Thermoproteota archaeon]|jgi:hypothetical protein|nr:hypothetical protein [Thermoproteota archaeon]